MARVTGVTLRKFSPVEDPQHALIQYMLLMLMLADMRFVNLGRMKRQRRNPRPAVGRTAWTRANTGTAVASGPAFRRPSAGGGGRQTCRSSTGRRSGWDSSPPP